MVRLISTVLALLFVALFIAVAYLAFHSASPGETWQSLGVVAFVRHVILVSGLLPLLVVCTSLVVGNTPKHIAYAVALSPLLLIVHAVVFAFSAHPDGFSYWAVQAIEAFIAIALIYVGVFKEKTSAHPPTGG